MPRDAGAHPAAPGHSTATLQEATLAEHYSAKQSIRREAVVHDRLALDLTSLSNERTFLAYVRTALAFIAAGAALIARFLGGGVWVVIGWVFVGVGLLIFAFGILRFVQTRKRVLARWAPDGDDES